MTVVLEPPLAPDVEEAPATEEVRRREPRSRAAVEYAAPARWLLAALLVGAAAIHLAMAPSHLGESAVEGWGFVVAAWAQLGLAVLVVARPSRGALVASIVTNLALIGAWAVSRTAGLPFGEHSGHAESVSIVDGATVALEGVAVLVAVLLLARPMGPVARSSGAAIIGGIAALALTTAAIASPAARDHASGSHGDHAAAGHGHDEAAAAAGGHAHGTTEDDLGFAALSNGHQHERGVDPLTTNQMTRLAGQLAVTTELMTQFPTIRAAEAAGWHRAGPFSPGLGTHYQRNIVMNPDGRMDTRDDLLNPLLVFDGLGPDAKLAGFMFMAYGTNGEPEGFAGPNDHWHYHEHVCIKYGADGAIDTPFGADLPGLTEQMCTDVGGMWIAYTGYMVHVWNIPGYESPDGMFTELNRAITCPDGTYYKIPTEETGLRDSTCLNA